MTESKEELKSLLIRVKDESEKDSLKLSIQKTKVMTSSPITSWKIKTGKVEAVTDFIFLSSKITADSDCSHEIKTYLLLGRKAMTNLDRVFKSRDLTLPTNGFPSSHVWMWELDRKEGWVLKNWCFSIVVLEKTLESPLDRKEIKPVSSKWNQPWIFIERTDAEVPIFWPPEPTYWKRSWCWERLTQKERQVAEMTGWHHRLNEHKFEQTPGNNEEQPGVLQFLGSLRVIHNLATEQ